LDLRLVDDEIGIFLGNPLSSNGEKSSLTNSKSLKTHHENNVFFLLLFDRGVTDRISGEQVLKQPKGFPQNS